MTSPAAEAVRRALDALETAAEARVMHTELEVHGTQHSHYLMLQVCQERNAGTLVICERRVGAADDQLRRAAHELLDDLAQMHPLA